MTSIAVITASLPHRADMLRAAAATVAAQSIGEAVNVRHHVLVNANITVAEARNQMLEQTTADWVAFLDDDDLLDNDHLEVLWRRAMADDLDVVIPHCRFDGPPLPTPSCCAGYCNRPFVLEDLRSHGIFPITVLVRREALAAVGNFRLEDTWEDWSAWNRMADAGARFEVVPETTWTYVTAHAADRRTTHIAEGAPSPADRRAARQAARRARLENRDA